jgi:hypothetical protein
MKASFSWILTVTALLLGTSCRRDLCKGAPTCFGAQASQCGHVPGCTPTPGCIEAPLRGIDCTSPATMAECARHAPDCTWTAKGCTESCSLITSEAACRNDGSCAWSACSGLARPCRDYSADMCPVSPIGCYVEPED